MKTKEAQKHMKEVAKKDIKAFRLAQGFLISDIDRELETLEEQESNSVGSKFTAIMKCQNVLLRLKNKAIAYK